MKYIKEFNKDKRMGLAKFESPPGSQGSSSRETTPEGAEKNFNRQKRIIKVKMNLIHKLSRIEQDQRGSYLVKSATTASITD